MLGLHPSLSILADFRLISGLEKTAGPNRVPDPRAGRKVLSLRDYRRARRKGFDVRDSIRLALMMATTRILRGGS